MLEVFNQKWLYQLSKKEIKWFFNKYLTRKEYIQLTILLFYNKFIVSFNIFFFSSLLLNVYFPENFYFLNFLFEKFSLLFVLLFLWFLTFSNFYLQNKFELLKEKKEILKWLNFFLPNYKYLSEESKEELKTILQKVIIIWWMRDSWLKYLNEEQEKKLNLSFLVISEENLVKDSYKRLKNIYSKEGEVIKIIDKKWIDKAKYLLEKQKEKLSINPLNEEKIININLKIESLNQCVNNYKDSVKKEFGELFYLLSQQNEIRKKLLKWNSKN